MVLGFQYSVSLEEGEVEDGEDEGENGEHLTPLHQHEEEINEYMKERGQI